MEEGIHHNVIAQPADEVVGECVLNQEDWAFFDDE
ncbi:hypothetical protein A2U01_0007472, partial [Trifolium medium]|nr:hypothetical protein [Trifolium medium]